MIGAPALCANAALRSGAGLVRLAVEAPIVSAALTLAPCATAVTGVKYVNTLPAWKRLRETIDDNDILAIGPGWSVDAARTALLRRILAETTKVTAIDADGLNNLCRVRTWWNLVKKRVATGGAVVLTPHTGEMQRLLDSAGIRRNARRDRDAAAADLARLCGAFIVHKGAGTVVTDGARLYVNATGNPGMATGGTGDVLTGVIAALCGQGLSAFDAAVLGVHAHGLAGDLAARRRGETGLIATDVVAHLPSAFQQLEHKKST